MAINSYGMNADDIQAEKRTQYKFNGWSQSNLCKYFVSIHGQHKIRSIRDASSASCSQSSLI